MLPKRSSVVTISTRAVETLRSDRIPAMTCITYAAKARESLLFVFNLFTWLHAISSRFTYPLYFAMHSYSYFILYPTGSNRSPDQSHPARGYWSDAIVFTIFPGTQHCTSSYTTL